MEIKLAKKSVCNGDKIIDNYIATENDLVTKNPLGHRPIRDIDWNSQKQQEQWRTYVLDKLEEEKKIKEHGTVTN